MGREQTGGDFTQRRDTNVLCASAVGRPEEDGETTTMVIVCSNTHMRDSSRVRYVDCTETTSRSTEDLAKIHYKYFTPRLLLR